MPIFWATGSIMTPERKQELIALREVRDELGVLFNEARDRWTQACSDLSYAMLEEMDWYQHITQKKEKPDWHAEVMGEEKKKSKREIDAMVQEMLKKVAQPEEGTDDSSRKPFWE